PVPGAQARRPLVSVRRALARGARGRHGAARRAQRHARARARRRAARAAEETRGRSELKRATDGGFMVCRRVGSWAIALLVAARAASAQTAQPHAEALVEWPVYGGSLASQFYSPLAQIDAHNVKDLKVAWRWSGANF